MKSRVAGLHGGGPRWSAAARVRQDAAVRGIPRARAMQFDEAGVLMAFEETEAELTANVASLGSIWRAWSSARKS